MFLSMTGFGRAAHSFLWGRVTFEIASVNHRYQEINVRLPREISSLESEALSLLRTSIKRGKIRLNAEIDWEPEYRTAKLDADALRSYYSQLNTTAISLNLPLLSDLTPLLSLPGVCDSSRTLDENGELNESWQTLISDTVEALMEMKRSEGAKLRAAVEMDLQEFEKLTSELSDRWNTAAPEALESLRSRIDKIAERYDLELEPGRVAQEISILSDKWDVAEELVRLAGHIAKFREIANGKHSEGRKLDFLIQEMNREVNTMGSKVSDAEFRWKIVDAKSCLERIREQIQNVE